MLRSSHGTQWAQLARRRWPTRVLDIARRTSSALPSVVVVGMVSTNDLERRFVVMLDARRSRTIVNVTDARGRSECRARGGFSVRLTPRRSACVVGRSAAGFTESCTGLDEGGSSQVRGGRIRSRAPEWMRTSQIRRSSHSRRARSRLNHAASSITSPRTVDF